MVAAWKPLSSQADLDQLMNIFGHFHDGCIREAHVWTEHFVDTDLRMSCTGDLDTRVRLLIQRQRVLDLECAYRDFGPAWNSQRVA